MKRLSEDRVADRPFGWYSSILLEASHTTHHQNLTTSRGASDELPTNSRGCVGCGTRGVISKVRLVFVGAVAMDVGPRWKGGWVQISISLLVRRSWGNLVRRLFEMVNV